MLLTAKTLKEEKLHLYSVQNGVCRICKRGLNPDVYSNHLDHDHALTGPRAGKVRGLLCSLCNAAEGQIKHKFDRSGLKGQDIDMVEWLKSLVEYHETCVHDSPIHPQFVPDRVKWFSRLNKTEMIAELDTQAIVHNLTMGKEQLVKCYRNGIRKILKDNQCLK